MRKPMIAMLGLTVLAVACGAAPSRPDAHGRIAIAVTERGFEPARLAAPAGQPLTLLVTRRTESTCAQELVIAAENVRRALPPDETVEVTFTPERAGEIRFACDMDMISGTIVVE